jgi:hypothetical protein
MESKNEVMRINIPLITTEAKKIAEQVEKGNILGLHETYSSFYKAYPILFKNLVEKTMTIEEVIVLLDTFNRAQNHFINNYT